MQHKRDARVSMAGPQMTPLPAPRQTWKPERNALCPGAVCRGRPSEGTATLPLVRGIRGVRCREDHVRALCIPAAAPLRHRCEHRCEQSPNSSGAPHTPHGGVRTQSAGPEGKHAWKRHILRFRTKAMPHRPHGRSAASGAWRRPGELLGASCWKHLAAG